MTIRPRHGTGNAGLQTGVPADGSLSVGWETGCSAGFQVRTPPAHPHHQPRVPQVRRVFVFAPSLGNHEPHPDSPESVR